jgi:pimeloyl-ACP methyl ester carboxylesterase
MNYSQAYKYAAVHNLKMFYREAGSKSSPTIVLLHGFPSSSHMFRNLKAELHLLDTGHFALEDSSDFIAKKIVMLLGKNGRE